MNQKNILKAFIIYFVIYFIFDIIPFYNIFYNNHVILSIFYGLMNILSYANNILVIALLYYLYKALNKGTFPQFLQQETAEEEQSGEEKKNHQVNKKDGPSLKYPIIIFIVLLCLSGLLGIIAIFGSHGLNFSEDIKLLLTTLIADFYLLMSLAHINQLYQKKLLAKIITRTGLVINILGLIFSFMTLWGHSSFFDMETGKSFFILMILGFCLAHQALLTIIKPKTLLVKLLLGATSIFVIMNALHLISMILEINNYEEGLSILAILSIFVVLGSVITPLLNRMDTIQNKQHPEELS